MIINDMNSCKLDKMFELRERFMKDLASRRPAVLQKWPVDISKKESQQIVRDTVLKGVEEMFEAMAHFKNWKPHRSTEISEFNQEEFLEEYVDAMNYFFSVLVMMGITHEELFDAYVKKDNIIHERLRKDY